MRRVFVAVACVFLMTAGTGCHKKKKHKKGEAAEETPAAAVEKKKPVKDQVHITVDGDGFHPDKIWAEKGRPITLVFTRDTEKTCATEVVFASENRREKLPVDKPVTVSMIPAHTGNIRFACPMGMFSGELEVQ